MKHIRVERFGSPAHPHSWDDDYIVDNTTEVKTYKEALDLLRSLGPCKEVKMTFCKKNGEDFQ